MESLKSLQQIPNIGKSLAEDLISLGICRVEDLKGRNADELYIRLCRQTGERQDPCVHDTFAAAIHFAETGERRKWWDFTPERKKRLGNCRSLLE